MIANKNTTDWNGYCGSCKFFAQGDTCSFCENPKQTDESKKGYCYYNFDCEFWEEGTSQSRIDYMNKLENK